MTTVVSTRTDILEQLFTRLEEESELRALAHDDLPPLPVSQTSSAEAVDAPPPTAPAPEPTPGATVRAAKERRRGSISISRFVGLPTADHTPAESRAVSTRPSRSSSIVTKPPFYQLDTQPIPYTGSADSLASDHADPTQDEEEAHMTTQMEKIQPARSISRAISRRLSRARDIPLPSPSSASTVMIDIAVEQATHESQNADDSAIVTVTTAAAVLRTQRSTPGLHDKAVAAMSSGWVSKAKDITSKFRRRSMAALTAPGAVAAR
ncbi:hypothetical protein BDW22DRAFT_1355902 [Trametopsis cervina]|nr:hypothetical protein BDW22DRAFT_1355902 [Trametopsis cervina]